MSQSADQRQFVPAQNPRAGLRESCLQDHERRPHAIIPTFSSRQRIEVRQQGPLQFDEVLSRRTVKQTLVTVPQPYARPRRQCTAQGNTRSLQAPAWLARSLPEQSGSPDPKNSAAQDRRKQTVPALALCMESAHFPALEVLKLPQHSRQFGGKPQAPPQVCFIGRS